MERPFTHQALFYADDEGFKAGIVPFLRDGLAEGEPALVALSEEKTSLLESELGDDAGGVRFVDMNALGRNPARIIPVWREFVAWTDGRPARGIGEPAWPGRSMPEFVECDHHESLLNRAFAEAFGFTLLCPYDAAALDDEVLEAARRSHPEIVEVGEVTPSAEYLPPDLAAPPLAGPLPPVPDHADELPFADGELVRVRRFAHERAGSAGLDQDRVTDFVFSVNELAANSIRHGGGTGLVRAWRDQLGLHCEVVDPGRIDDPLLGRARPEPEQTDGRGLWLVNQLCDLVQLRSGERGTIARVSMKLS